MKKVAKCALKKNVWKRRKVTTEAKTGGIIVPNVLYGSETWEMNAGLRRKEDVFEMSYLRPIRGHHTMWDRMRNEDIRMGYGLKYKLSGGWISRS